MKKQIVDHLNRELRLHPTSGTAQPSEELARCAAIACAYTRLEQCVAVLSDLQRGTSQLFYGDFARVLGLSPASPGTQIGSIWEEEILGRIHPDDLTAKYLQELRFFRFVSHRPRLRRGDCHLAAQLRMRDAAGDYRTVLHRLFYPAFSAEGRPCMALCLYNPMPDRLAGDSALAAGLVEGLAVDLLTGESTPLAGRDGTSLLSERERQVLRLIGSGMTSKAIAGRLSLSIHTVSRHRQEILRKLQVRNSIEACRIARELGIL